MLMNYKGGPPILRGGPPLGTIFMDLAVLIDFMVYSVGMYNKAYLVNCIFDLSIEISNHI